MSWLHALGIIIRCVATYRLCAGIHAWYYHGWVRLPLSWSYPHGI